MPSTSQSRGLDPYPPTLSVAVDLVAGRITLAGELDRENAHHLVDAVEALHGTRHLRWELDAAGVTFCDAGGVRSLIAAQVLAARAGRRLLLVRPSRCVDRLVGLVGLDDLVRTALAQEAAGAATPHPPNLVLPLTRRSAEPAGERAGGLYPIAG